MPWLWLALSVIWLVVVFVTALPAWTLAIWVATTIGSVSIIWCASSTYRCSAAAVPARPAGKTQKTRE